jgi:hypothetical protein
MALKSPARSLKAQARRSPSTWVEREEEARKALSVPLLEERTAVGTVPATATAAEAGVEAISSFSALISWPPEAGVAMESSVAAPAQRLIRARLEMGATLTQSAAPVSP